MPCSLCGCLHKPFELPVCDGCGADNWHFREFVGMDRARFMCGSVGCDRRVEVLVCPARREP